MRTPLFQLQENNGPLLLNFPHSGVFIPKKIAAQLNVKGTGIADTDWHVPELYRFADKSVTWLQATHARYVVDLNRDPDGSSLYPGQAGTGICPTTDFAGHEIYQEGHQPETTRRVARYFDPYHTQMAMQVNRIYAVNDICVLLDCHSIKSRVPRLFEGSLPDLNLGTFDGKSCDPGLTRLVCEVLSGSDFSLAHDQRFKGGWITRKYGRPRYGLHALQLEISQSTYMDENNPDKFDPKRAAPLIAVLRKFVHTLQEWAIQQGKL